MNAPGIEPGNSVINPSLVLATSLTFRLAVVMHHRISLRCSLAGIVASFALAGWMSRLFSAICRLDRGRHRITNELTDRLGNFGSQFMLNVFERTAHTLHAVFRGNSGHTLGMRR